jgi:hypothetical protein
MPKIIDMKQETLKKKTKMHTLEHFIQTEFTRDNADISVKIPKYNGEPVEARVFAGSGFNAKEVIKVSFDYDVGDVKIKSMDVFDRLYQYTAIKVAEKYEQLLGKGEEVEIYLN